MDRGALEPLIALFELPYFQRAWVIRELALAPRILFFWGNQMIQGDELLKCAQLMTAMREKDNDLNFSRSYLSVSKII
jgi:hypothetical protein